MENIQDCFMEKIKQFINLSQNIQSDVEIKYEYLKLVKKYHPDVNKNIDNKTANEYMIIINYIYEHLINKKQIKPKQTDEYEKNKIDGKYWFINDYGKKEYVKDKALYIYKLGVLEYQKTYHIMFNNPSYNGHKEETSYEVIKHLYKCYKYLREVIEIDKEGNYGEMAKTFLPYAYEMNERITRGLKTNNEISYPLSPA